MQESFFNSEQNLLNYPNWFLFEDTENAYQVLVNLIIPRSPLLAYEFGIVQFYGALDLHIDEFLLLTRESFGIPSSVPIAEMLDITSRQLFLTNGSDEAFPVVSTTMMGYYSEWSGYGSTRLDEPNQRKLEYYPISWKQVGYPGPSLGYHALRSYQFT